jgi:hypothetical protein
MEREDNGALGELRELLEWCAEAQATVTWEAWKGRTPKVMAATPKTGWSEGDDFVKVIKDLQEAHKTLRDHPISQYQTMFGPQDPSDWEEQPEDTDQPKEPEEQLEDADEARETEECVGDSNTKESPEEG